MNKRQRKKFKKKGYRKKYHLFWYWLIQLEDQRVIRYLMKNDGKGKIRKCYVYTGVHITSCSGPEIMEYKPVKFPDGRDMSLEERYHHYVDGLSEESTMKKVWNNWLAGIK